MGLKKTRLMNCDYGNSTHAPVTRLLNDVRLWRHQISSISKTVHTTVADLTKSDSITSLASAALPRISTERFSLAGLSMGGHVTLEIMRQAPERVLSLAFIDTSARADTLEATAGRRKLMRKE